MLCTYGDRTLKNVNCNISTVWIIILSCFSLRQHKMSALFYFTLIFTSGIFEIIQNSVLHACIVISLAITRTETSHELIKSRMENGRFVNSFNPQYESPHFGLVLAWKITSSDNTRLPSSKRALDVLLPVIRHEKPEELYFKEPGLRFIWIGHASCFIQMNNFRFLVDPVFR